MTINPTRFSEDQSGDITIPSSVETPSTLNEMVETLVEIHITRHLPQNMQHLEKFFDKTYREVYNAESRGFFDDPDIDLAFQQYAIKRDEELNRSQVITFGTFLPAYNLAMAYNSRDRRYLSRFDSEDSPNVQTLLLGCSSITTAQEYTAIIQSINPKAIANIIDINPTIIAVLKASCAKFSIKDNETDEPIVSFWQNRMDPLSFKADVSKFGVADTTNLEQSEIADNSQDMIFTNMLIKNLLSSDDPKTALLTLFKGIAAKLKDGSRLVMVEDLSAQEAIDLTEIARSVGLEITGPNGRNTKAPMVNRGRQSINGTLEALNNGFDEKQWGLSYGRRSVPDSLYSGKGFTIDNSRPTDISLLIFEKKAITN